MKNGPSSREWASSLKIRPATIDDAELLWHWVNDPQVRENSLHPEPISLVPHLQWYQAKLESPATRIWIIEENGAPIAQIRYDRIEPSSAEIDYSVAFAYRGRGVGTEAVRHTWALACKELEVVQVVGLVLAANVASCRVFTKAGFEQVAGVNRNGQECMVFVRKKRCTVAVCG